MSSENAIWFLIILMPLAAFLYASVGHGGASSYLMLLTLFHYVPEQIRTTALVLNILVSGVAFLSYQRVCVFPTKLFISLIIFSVPAAYLGGTFKVDVVLYKKILGILLLFPALRLFNVFPISNKIIVENKIWIASALGLGIGFFSGLIGIGGGIILSPILLMMGWTNVKETAAVSAFFIFLNSIAGLIGSGSFQFQIDSQIQILLPLTVVAGVVGAYLGAHRFNVPVLKYLLGIVLFIASVKFILV